MNNMNNMNNMTVREYIESLSFEDRMFASSAISGENKFLAMLEGDLDSEQNERLIRLLSGHVVNNGPQSIKMAILAGKAIKSSLEYPIKPKNHVTQMIKNYIKKVLK